MYETDFYHRGGANQAYKLKKMGEDCYFLTSILNW